MPTPGCRVHHDQADDERHGTDDFEIQQRQAAGLADLLHVFHAGDADDDGTEDHRRDDHLDQLDEAIAQRLHGFTGGRIEVAQRDTDDDGTQDLEIQGFVKGRFLRRHSAFSLNMDDRRSVETACHCRIVVRSGGCLLFVRENSPPGSAASISQSFRAGIVGNHIAFKEAANSFILHSAWQQDSLYSVLD
jgi:hypothetical protein